MNYSLWLTSELAPLLLVAVLAPGLKKEEEPRLHRALTVFGTIYGPLLFVTLYCMVTAHPKSELLHTIVFVCALAVAVVYLLRSRQRR